MNRPVPIQQIARQLGVSREHLIRSFHSQIGTTPAEWLRRHRLQRVADNDDSYVAPADMLAELLDDNRQLAAFMRQTHDLCDDHDDVATESLLEGFIEQTEERIWFLFETSRGM